MASGDHETTTIRYEEEFVTNSRGMKLFTCRWLPISCEPKALVFLCHGYASECSISMKGVARKLVEVGYAVYGMDCQGHGKSDGLQGYIPSFDALVNDYSNHYSQICERQENEKKMRVLLGESMGGAMALRLHRLKPHFWDAAVLLAPMCKIAEEIKPPAIVLNILTKLSKIIPTWRIIIPSQDIIDAAFRNPEIRKEIRSNPYCYKGRPRLQTGNELLSVSMDLEKRLHEVALPFLVLHGDKDILADPSASKLLYETASSTDKTLKLYPGMWHSLIYGEMPENMNVVFSNIIGWLDQRVAMGNSRLERQQKNASDTLIKPET